MFVNDKTGQRAAELRGYRSETEDEARARLEAAGWNFDVEFEWIDSEKLFKLKVKEEDSDASTEEVEA